MTFKKPAFPVGRIGRGALLGAALAFGAAVFAPVVAQTSGTQPAAAPKAKAAKASGAPFAGFGGNSREPIKIDSNKLEVFDKENRAIYSGDVVVVQGQTTVRSTTMTVHYTSNKTAGAGGAVLESAPGMPAASGIPGPPLGLPACHVPCSTRRRASSCG